MKCNECGKENPHRHDPNYMCGACISDLVKYCEGRKKQSMTTTPQKAKSDKVETGLVLIPWYSILELGKIFIEGLRYGRDNWKKGVNDKEYQEERLEHAMLHLLKWKEGDRTEQHLAKVMWFCATQLELERIEREPVRQEIRAGKVEVPYTRPAQGESF